MGGGRCWRTRSITRAYRVDRVSSKQAVVSAGGVNVPADGRTTPLVSVAPRAISPQPSQQDRFAKTGPEEWAEFPFLQQHLPRLRQQEGAESLKALAAIGARDEKENRNTVHSATTLRSACH